MRTLLLAATLLALCAFATPRAAMARGSFGIGVNLSAPVYVHGSSYYQPVRHRYYRDDDYYYRPRHYRQRTYDNDYYYRPRYYRQRYYDNDYYYRPRYYRQRTYDNDYYYRPRYCE